MATDPNDQDAVDLESEAWNPSGLLNKIDGSED